MMACLSPGPLPTLWSLNGAGKRAAVLVGSCGHHDMEVRFLVLVTEAETARTEVWGLGQEDLVGQCSIEFELLCSSERQRACFCGIVPQSSEVW